MSYQRKQFESFKEKRRYVRKMRARSKRLFNTYAGIIGDKLQEKENQED